MNGDGKINAPASPITLANIKNKATREKIDITQLPIDIEVTFYNNQDHDEVVYSTTRRIIVSNKSDLSFLLEGGSLPGD